MAAVYDFYQNMKAGGVDQAQKMEMNGRGKINLATELKCLLLIHNG